MSHENKLEQFCSCSCFCHSQPNNIGGCMSCNCKPVYGTGTFTINNSYDQLMKMEDRINKLENDFKIKLKVDMDKWEEYFRSLPTQNKNPHKCPLCEGVGENAICLNGVRIEIKKCKPCDGKGIVWG